MSWIALLVVTSSFGALACVEIHGGAVELSWSLRTFEGDSIRRCEDARIERVRLCWEPPETGEGGCRPPNLRDLECRKESGATGFEVPPGPVSLSILPVCAGGAPAIPGTYEVPPPIVRTVEMGEVVTLNSLLIVATDQESERSACPPAGCTCDP